MTSKNEQTLMLMTWAVSFHGLSPEDAEAVASKAIDELGGDLSKVKPSDAVHKFTEIYYGLNQQGFVSATDAPLWEDYGFVRPVEIMDKETGNGFLSDGTVIDAFALGAYLSKPEWSDPGDIYGIHPGNGSLILSSGGTVPFIENEEIRKRVWVTVFCNPRNIDQQQIDEIVKNPPELSDTPEYLEQQAVNFYNLIEKAAEKKRQEIDQQYDWAHQHDHDHHPPNPEINTQATDPQTESDVVVVEGQSELYKPPPYVE